LGKDFGAFLIPLMYILMLRVQKIEIYCARLPLRVPGKHLQRALCNFDKDLPVFKASSLWQFLSLLLCICVSHDGPISEL
jgi:hypothetical protein